MKTNINKAIAFLSVAAISLTQITSTSAQTKIGEATVVGNDGLKQNIMYTTGPKTATASVNGIRVNARVAPTLNFKISADSINLNTLTPGRASTGNVKLEVGTNAARGVVVTARSTKGKLQHTTENANFINSTHRGESYKYLSSPGSNDSSASGYAKTATLNAEVVNATTEHPVLSTNKPEKLNNVDDATFTVSVTATDETPVGDYSDTVIFTVTGNF